MVALVAPSTTEEAIQALPATTRPLILQGDALTMLRTLPAECVQTCVTSPPYYGLRSYETTPQVWDADPSCQHVWGTAIRTPWANEAPEPHGRKKNSKASHERTKETCPFCQTCGAWRGELGQEPTVALYIQHLVSVFREVWRVLCPNGTLWLNIADSYAAGGHEWGGGSLSEQRNHMVICGGSKPRTPPPGLKKKDLCLIPQRLAIALQEFGWYVRSDIIWVKESTMPESVEDRPTHAHEYVWLLTKSERYVYDAAAIAEPTKTGARGSLFTIGKTATAHPGASAKPRQEAETRNARDWWLINPEPFPGAHFATMPTKLVSRCILAGSHPGDIVLDPFLGSGTVAMVAQRYERRSIGIELNPQYIEIAQRRCAQANLWAEIGVADGN